MPGRREKGGHCLPCPHFDVKVIQRSKRQSAVASAAYQSGERLFSEYDQKQKYYSHKSEIVHTEIMLPPHAPPEYADRNTLWNAAEAIEKQWNSQLARRFVLALSLIHISALAAASYPFVDLPPGNILRCKLFPSSKFVIHLFQKQRCGSII